MNLVASVQQLPPSRPGPLRAFPFRHDEAVPRTERRLRVLKCGYQKHRHLVSDSSSPEVRSLVRNLSKAFTFTNCRCGATNYRVIEDIQMKLLFTAVLGLGLSGLAVPSFSADEVACQKNWETADVNKDGSLDAAEGTKHLDAIKTSGKTFDADNDGKLTTAEFTEACKADAFKDIK